MQYYDFVSFAQTVHDRGGRRGAQNGKTASNSTKTVATFVDAYAHITRLSDSGDYLIIIFVTQKREKSFQYLKPAGKGKN